MNKKPGTILGLILLFCSLPAALGQTVMIDIGSGSGSSGSTVRVPVYLQTVGIAQPAAAQLDVGFSTSQLTFSKVSVGPAIQGTGKEVVSNILSPGNLRMIIVSDDQSVIPNGVVAYLEFQVAAGLSAVTSPLQGSNSRASSPDGKAMATTPGDGLVIVNGGIANPRELFFAQVADGSGYLTNFILVNPESSPVAVLLELYKRDGTPLAFNIRGNLDNAFSFTLPARGMATLESTNLGDLKDGWARVRSAAKIGGSIIYAYNPTGSGAISEAGIDPSPPATSFSLSMDTRRGFLAGIAIANPNSASVTLQLILYNNAGQQQGSPKSEVVPGMNSKVWLLDQLFTGVPASFTGVVTVASTGGSVVGTTLRLNGSVSSFASIPVIIPGQSGTPNDLYFPQVADGGGFSVNFALVNPGTAAITATLELFQPDGTPMRFTLNGSYLSAFPIALPARGLVLLESSNAGAVTQSGWARVRASGPVGGSILYVFTTTPGVDRDSAGINPGEQTTAFSLSVDTRNSFLSGIAVANPGSSPAQIQLTLYDSTGLQRGQRSETVAAMNQKTWQVEQLFPVAGSNFTGMITVNAGQSKVLGTTLRYNPDLSVFASIPVIW